MAYRLLPDMRVHVGHISSGATMFLKREQDGKLVPSSDSVDHGEAVAVLEKGHGDHVLVSRQDGVRGYVRVRHLHVQAWPLERKLTLDAAWSQTFVGTQGKLSEFRIIGERLSFGDGSRTHAIRVHGSHALTVADYPGHILLLDGAKTAVVVWNGSAVVEVAAALGAAAPEAVGHGADSLAPGWKAVFTWAAHDVAARVGVQWTVTTSGRSIARDKAPASPIHILTAHAWFLQSGGGTRVFLLDEGGGTPIEP